MTLRSAERASPPDSASVRRDAIRRYRTAMQEVPGWLDVTDAIVLALLDELQAEAGAAGDVLEIGAYQGRTAILLQYFCRARERLVVCDVFESVTFNPETERERALFYQDLTRATFERNFRLFHPMLPTVFQCRSKELAGQIPAGSCRLIHVDGAHLHEIVRHDIALARDLLRPGGIVVLDDYRTDHTPGVAAAVWEAMLAGGLVPICLTPSKLYGTWGDAGVLAGRLRERAAACPELFTELQTVCGRELLRITDAAAGGDSREQALAVKVEQLGRTEAGLRAELEKSTGERAALRARVEEQHIELARRDLTIHDLALEVRLLESALGEGVGTDTPGSRSTRRS